MNLDPAQQQKVKDWISQGLQPAEIQKKLADELGVRLTYMEVRFLLDDLKLQPKDKEPAPTPPPSLQSGAAGAAPAPAGGKPGIGPALPEDEPMGGGVSISVDQVTRPGAVVSGKVTFSDGKWAAWSLDQYGRLGLAPSEKGYKPSQEDLLAFPSELQNELTRSGF